MSTTAGTTVIAVEDIKDWRGQDVLDAQGDKLGKLDEVYYDTRTDLPSFGAVKSGTLSKHVTLVPLTAATAGQSYVRVTISKDQFKNAPSFDPDAELSADDEAGSYRYFGLDYEPDPQGARRLAKH